VIACYSSLRPLVDLSLPVLRVEQQEFCREVTDQAQKAFWILSRHLRVLREIQLPEPVLPQLETVHQVLENLVLDYKF
jgi:hypothetical protein